MHYQLEEQQLASQNDDFFNCWQKSKDFKTIHDAGKNNDLESQESNQLQNRRLYKSKFREDSNLHAATETYSDVIDQFPTAP